MNHQQAREYVREGFFGVFGRDPTLTEAQLCQAVGWLEGQYGMGWGVHDTGYGSNNWGAIQAGSAWGGETFEHKDSSPQSDGTNKWYVTKFRKYPTPREGAADLVRCVYQWHKRETVLQAASAGMVYRFSIELHATGYYEGFGATPQARIANHHKAVMSALRIITRALNEPLPSEETTEPGTDSSNFPTLMQGSLELDAIKVLQGFLGLEQDGSFGPLTLAAVIQFQKDHGLTADGWVGRQTWNALT